MIGNTQNEEIAEHRLIARIFDMQPDSVIWLIPRFSEGNNTVPVDFEIGYCNTAACLILNASKQQLIGKMLKAVNSVDDEYRKRIYEQCVNVWTTGAHSEFTYYSPEVNKHFNTQRSKIQNGVLSITRDHTLFVKNREEKDQQAELLDRIIATSTSGISLYEAIRNKQGEIIDFKLRLANQKCADITAFSLEELYKYTVKELMVIRGQSRFFEIICKVVETGEQVYTEYYSEARDQWLGLSIKKFNDGYILNYIDITVTKKLEKKAQDQNDMLKSILNASITGLITIQAIYAPSGKIEDFKFVLLNEAAKKLLNIKEADKSKTYLSVFPKAKTNGFFDLYVNALITGVPVSKEFFYKGDGYNGWYYISVSKMNDDTLVQSFADINHTKENGNTTSRTD